jgi:hypothetical protein
MADDHLAFQAWTDLWINCPPVWRKPYLLFINPVDRNIHWIELIFGVNQRFVFVLQETLAEACDTDLADARQVGVGSFHVNHNEAHTLCSARNDDT